MQEFTKDPTWSKETYQRVARETGLSESQVYKWGWDQKNKKAEEDEENNENDEMDFEENESDNNKHQIDPQTEKNIGNAAQKHDLKLQLDQAISQVVITNDELNNGITRPHNMDPKDGQEKSTVLGDLSNKEK